MQALPERFINTQVWFDKDQDSTVVLAALALFSRSVFDRLGILQGPIAVNGCLCFLACGMSSFTEYVSGSRSVL